MLIVTIHKDKNNGRQTEKKQTNYQIYGYEKKMETEYKIEYPSLMMKQSEQTNNNHISSVYFTYLFRLKFLKI